MSLHLKVTGEDYEDVHPEVFLSDFLENPKAFKVEIEEPKALTAQLKIAREALENMDKIPNGFTEKSTLKEALIVCSEKIASARTALQKIEELDEKPGR